MKEKQTKVRNMRKNETMEKKMKRKSMRTKLLDLDLERALGLKVSFKCLSNFLKTLRDKKKLIAQVAMEIETSINKCNYQQCIRICIFVVISWLHGCRIRFMVTIILLL